MSTETPISPVPASIAHDINVLSDVTRTLIDSHKGYATCVDAVDDSYALAKSFGERADARAALIAEFKAEIAALGGDAPNEGSIAGAAHRVWTSFTTLFSDDEKAAIEAVDDGEEYLAEKIERALDSDVLAARTRDLLVRAHASAREGERFADALDKAL